MHSFKKLHKVTKSTTVTYADFLKLKNHEWSLLIFIFDAYLLVLSCIIGKDGKINCKGILSKAREIPRCIYVQQL